MMAALLAFALTWLAIPLIRQGYVLGLTGWAWQAQLSLLNGNQLPFWQLFLLSLVVALAVNTALQRIGLSILAVVITIGCVVSVVFVVYQVAKYKGASKTDFLVDEAHFDPDHHELVAVLCDDGYGGVVTRRVDKATHKLLPGIVLISKWTEIPVLHR